MKEVNGNTGHWSLTKGLGAWREDGANMNKYIVDHQHLEECCQNEMKKVPPLLPEE